MLTFPTGLFSPTSMRARLVGAATSGGQSVSGISQSAMSSGGGLWLFEFGQAVLWDRTLFKTWEAIVAASDNGATPFIVPLCARRLGPFVDPALPDGVSFDDSTTFADGALWEGSEVTATLTGSAALRATRISLNIDHDLIGGEPFTLWHTARGQRMYRVTRVLDQADGVADIEIRPPLREACAGGMVADFDNPRCTMTVVGDMAALLDMQKFGAGQVQFVEDFSPIEPT